MVKKTVKAIAFALLIPSLLFVITCRDPSSDNYSPFVDPPLEENTVSVEDITIDSEDLELNIGESIKITANITPDPLNYKHKVEWLSDNPDVVSITHEGNQTGRVVAHVTTYSEVTLKANRAGKAVITAKATDGSGVSDSITVTVKAEVDTVSINGGDLTLKLGGTAELSATTLPITATDKTVRWTSSNPDVAAIDPETGIVTAVSVGEAEITAWAQDGSDRTASIKVTISEEDPPKVGHITITSGDLPELTVGDMVRLVTGVTPPEAGNKNVSWTSSNPAVATIDKSGVLTAVSLGEAVITATAQDGSGKSGSINVTVSEAAPKQDELVTSITINLTGKPEIQVGYTIDLSVTALPSEAANKEVSWKSSNPLVATITDDGELTAIAEGTVTITATAKDGSDKSGTITIKVTPAASPPEPVNKIKINGGNVALKAGQSANLSVTVSPDNAGNKNVTWSSSNTNVAIVAANGKVTAVANGTAIITATAKDSSGVSGSITVTVTDITVDVTDVKIDGGDFSITIGKTKLLSATVSPSNAGNKNVFWSSSNPDIAVIAANGEVTAIGVGTAEITAAAQDGSGKNDTVTVKVNPVLVTGISLEEGDFSLFIGGGNVLNASVTPDDATNSAVTWTSSPSGIVNIIGTGKTVAVTALAKGTATVTVRANDGSNQSASVKITVIKLVTSVVIDPSAFTLLTGSVANTKQLTVNVQPSDASNRDVTWSTSNADIATVSMGGQVTSVAAGTATITATANDGSGKTDTVTVTVAKPVSSITLAPDNFSLDVGDTKTLSVTVEPSTANQAVTWSSGTPATATVDASGKVTAVAAGTSAVIITATAADGSGTKGTATVTVNSVKVSEVKINGGNLELEIGSSTVLTVTVSPEKAGNKEVTWKSSNDSIATVDGVGEVTAKAVGGPVTITATAKDGSGKFGTIAVTVTAIPPKKVESVQINGLNVQELFVGGSTILQVTVLPFDAGNTGVTWSSSNTGVATVDSSGKVTGVGDGTATITATAADGSGKQSTVSIKVSPVQVIGVSISGSGIVQKKFDLTVKDTKTLSVTVTPENATNDKVTWSSSDPAIASVDTNGKVTAIAVGNATITAKADDGSGKQDTVTVTVKAIPVESVSITENNFSLLVGGTQTLHATVTPSDAGDTRVTWSSSNTAVATVSNGLVTAKATGTAIITVTSAADSAKKDTVTVEVKAVFVESVSINGGDFKLVVGKTKDLTVTVLPSNAGNTSVTWLSSADNIASVDANGKVTAGTTTGTAVITATAKDGSGKQGTVEVEVEPQLVESITLGDNFYLTVGDTKTLSLSVTPSNATNKTVTWSTSDPSKATVDENGAVKAIASGSATITAKANDDSGKTGTVIVTVNAVKVNSISIEGGDFTLFIGKTKTLKEIVGPEAAGNKTVKWTSGNPSVATVSENGGAVTAVSAGTALITAAAQDGSGTTGSVTVTVPKPVTSVAINQSAFTLLTGSAANTKQLTVNVQPTDAGNRDVTWSSNPSGVVTVSTGGLVTSVAVGTAEITATAADGSGKTGTVSVTVKKPVSTININEGNFTLLTGSVNHTKQLTVEVEPSDAGNKDVNWSTSDSRIATVSGGLVTSGSTTGTAVITATAADGSGVTKSVTVTVNKPVSGVTINESDFTLLTGSEANTKQLTVNVAVTWSSSENLVATVSDGLVTAIGIGEATITATAADGSGKSDTVKVTVVKPVTSIAIDQTAFTLLTGSVNHTKPLTVTVNSDAGIKDVNWSSSDNAKATVSATGLVTSGNTTGTVTITATAADGSGKSASVTVTIAKPVSTININIEGGDFSLFIGTAKQLTATVGPYDAANKTVIWSGGTIGVATVDASGKVTAGTTTGTVTITATAADGSGVTKSVTVTVKKAVTSVAIDQSAFTLLTGTAGHTKQLTVTVQPDDASNNEVTWTSSDSNKATVSTSGLVTSGNTTGEVTITATAKDGSGKTGTVTVKIVLPVSRIDLEDNFSLFVGATPRTINASVNPTNAGNTTLNWTSDKPAIATVDASGKVTAVAAGTAVITATAADGSGVTKSVTVTVTVPVSSIAITGGDFSLFTGTTKTLSVTVEPGTATNKTLNWNSSDTGVATVDSSGKVTAVAAGTSKITATAADGSGKSASVTVTVTVPVSGITITGGDFSLFTGTTGNTKTLAVTIEPSTASNKTVTWLSATPATATVDTSGKVTAVAVGTSVITATANDGSGKTASVTVTVNRPVTSVAIDQSAFTLLTGSAGNTKQLTVTVQPTDASNKAVTWSSSDSAKATVSTSGVVTSGTTTGTVTITATANDGSGKAGTVTVTIAKPVDSVAINEAAFTLLTGSEANTKQLSVTVLPTDAGNKAVTWKSSNESRATVSASGLVTSAGTQSGSSVITATAADGSGKSASVTVTIALPVSNIDIGTDFSLAVGGTKTLTATTIPANKAVTWSSGTPGVATVDSSGKVTAVAAGTSVITATATDGSGKTGTVTVTVTVPVTSVAIKTEYDTIVDITGNAFSLPIGDTRALAVTVLPDNATNKTVNWSSSDESKATVNASGVVTGKAAGTSVITATSSADSTKKSTVTVTVIATAIPYTWNFQEAITGWTAYDSNNANATTMTKDSVYLNGMTLLASQRSSRWLATQAKPTGSDFSNGYVLPNGATADGKYFLKISNVQGPFRITLNYTDSGTGTSNSGRYPIIFVNGVDKKHGEETDKTNPKIVIYDYTGTDKVTVQLGCAYNTTTSSSGGIRMHDVILAQYVAVTGLTVSPTTASVAVGATTTITPAIAPAGATNKDVTWTSSANGVATVNGGVVTGVAKGSATITATSAADSAKTATTTVTVTQPVTGITVAFSPASPITAGNTTTASATITPTTANTKTVTWSSSNTAVAIVNETTGVVTAVAAGTATITATAQDGSGVTGAASLTVNAATVAVTGVAIDGGNFSLTNGSTKQLTVTITPANATNPAVTWSATGAASVSSTGLVTAGNTAGTATITATSVSNTGVKGSITVTVTVVPATTIPYTWTFNNDMPISGWEEYNSTDDNTYKTAKAYENNMTLVPGANNNGSGARWYPARNAPSSGGFSSGCLQPNGAFTGTTYFAEIVNVQGPFVVTLNYTDTGDTNKGRKAVISIDGSSVLTGPAADGSSKPITASYKYTGTGKVKIQLGCDNPIRLYDVDLAPVVAVTGVSIAEGSAISMAAGGTKTLTANVTPSNANDKTVTWKSSNTAVATVDSSSGKVTVPSGASGSATITVTTNDGSKTATTTVTVTPAVTSITLSPTTASIAVGSMQQLSKTVNPSGANQNVTWSSSNTSVATVNSSGLVTGVNGGTATITATAADGSGKTATATITVSVAVTGVTIDQTGPLSLPNGGSVTLSATVSPSTVTNKTVTWAIASGSGATVNSTTGVVTATAGSGSVTIRATSAADTSKTATIVINLTAASGSFGPVTITETLGWLESIVVKWNKLSAASKYTVEYQISGGSWTSIDDMLIREYASYYRADILGLTAGTYSVRVTPVNSSGTNGTAATAGSITVKAHDRNGFAHSTKSPLGSNVANGIGAYKNDGTLKANAKVLYVTATNASTVTLDVKESASKTSTFTGISQILAARQKGYDDTPLAVRFIGLIKQSDISSHLNSLNLLDFKGKADGATGGVGNITIEGVGNDATAYGWGVHVRAYKSVEVRNMGFMMFTDDGVSLEVDNQNIWVHNNDIFYGANGGGDKAKGDGAMDCKTSGYVTMSYNHFWDSGKCNLLGNGTETPEYITYHHNWYDHSDSRHPRVRWHSVHVYNNYYDGNSKYGIGATRNSSIFAEENFFRNTKNPMLISMQGTDTKSGTDEKNGSFSSEDGGMIKAYNNTLQNLSSTTYIKWSSTNNVHFDAYEANRTTIVPSSVTTKKGGFTYNNFDSTLGFGAGGLNASSIDSAATAKTNVMTYAGRTGGKQRLDISFDFNDSVDDADHDRNAALDSLIANYTTGLKSIQSGGSSGGGGSTSVTFSGLTANGSSSSTTTQLTLTFSAAISGLAAGDITLSGVSGVSKGTLSGSGPSYTLPISGFTAGGTLTVAVAKSNYTITNPSRTVTIYYSSGSSGGGNSGSTITCSFVLNTPGQGSSVATTNSDFTITTGSGASGLSKVINGTTYMVALKLESSTVLTFTTTAVMKLTAYTDATGIKLDDTNYSASSEIVTVTSLAAGTHTIKRVSGSGNLYLIELTP